MILEKLKADVGDQVYEKAVSHYRSGDVKSYTVTRKGPRFQIKAIVKGDTACGVSLNLDFSHEPVKYDHYCTCASSGTGLCEHASAVFYQFINDDHPKMGLGKQKSDKTEGLVWLKQLCATSFEDPSLLYEIANLDNLNTDFWITISKGRSEPFVIRLLESLGDVNVSTQKREETFGLLFHFDYTIFSYLEKALSRKETQRRMIFLPKSPENFKIILMLIQSGRAINSDTGERLILGEPLYPRINLEGNETCLKFHYDLTEFEYQGFVHHSLHYLFHQSTLHIIDTVALAKMPAEITVPPEELGTVLFEVIPQLRKRFPLEPQPEFLAHHLMLQEPEIHLSFDYQSGIVICQPEIRLPEQIYQGGECLDLIHGPAVYVRSSTDIHQWYGINREPLQQLLKFFTLHKFEFTATGWAIQHEGHLLKFMMNGLEQLPGEWRIITSSAFREMKIIPVPLEPVVSFDLNEKIDWFDFNVFYNLGGETYTHQKILTMLRRTDAGNFLQIGNQWFFVDDLSKADHLEQSCFAGNGSLKRHNYDLIFFRQMLREHGITVTGNSWYDRFEADISRENLIETYPVPEIAHGALRTYQKEGYYWLRFLHKYRFGGILADDMGLGKTLQVLTLIKSISRDNPVLVVCPLSLIYNWAGELAKFFPDLSYLVYYGSPAEREQLRLTFGAKDIIITTYDMVVNDIPSLQDCTFDYCILDEAQHIKNQESQRARECKKLKALHRLALTGTPLENKLEELWSLFDFIMPGFLGSQAEFKERYAAPMRKSNEEGKEVINLLRKRIAPFLLRRQKESVLTELPPKIINQHNIMMTQLQEDAYRTILKQVKHDVLCAVSNYGLEKSRITILTALTKLRQVCDHPGLVLPEVGERADSGKMDALMELIYEAIDGGHKVVVFSQFVRMLKLIRAKLQAARISLVYLDGSTTDRMDRINIFNNNPEIPVFLISLKAGGVGINLTSADIVIHVDPWWNPMTEEQATDRVHRMGQQRQVMVYKLVTVGTVEEKLVKLQNRKKAVFEAVFQDTSEPVNHLTWEDISELFEIEGSN